ncbi:MAG: sigma-70 family RNA polymerase sigma factor [Bdellovibrionales bacterium]|nr:sigma-70 family RNA polymerase sigma factor [Bdellovibrionales bacterium]
MEQSVNGKPLSFYLNWIQKMVRHYCKAKGLPLENLDDYTQAGAIGFLEASKRFDPNRGVPFMAYAITRVRGALIDEIRAQSLLSKRSYQLKKQEAANGASCAGLDKGILAFRDENPLEESSLLAHEETPCALFERTETVSILRKAYSQLNQEEQTIIYEHYQLDRSLSEISKSNASRSKATVCRMHTRALAKMRNNQEMELEQLLH